LVSMPHIGEEKFSFPWLGLVEKKKVEKKLCF
jgi:hypothetical protein